MAESIILKKSKSFALRIIKLYKYLTEEKKEFVLSKQLLRSGTSIGANAKEGSYGQSKADLCARLFVAQKECAETEYCIGLNFFMKAITSISPNLIASTKIAKN